MTPRRVNVSEFHLVETAPGLFVRFLDAQERALPTAPIIGPLLEGCSEVLDVGCGLGGDTAELQACLRARVVGVDSAPSMVREAATRHRVPGLAFAVADAASLPFGDERFDAVIAVRVLQHLADPLRAVREMHRVLRPGGKVVVYDTDHGATAIDSEHPQLLARLQEATNRQLNPNAGRSLRRYLLTAGFDVVVIDVTTRTGPSHSVLPPPVLSLLTREAVEAGAMTASEAALLEESWDGMKPDGGFAVVLRFLAHGIKTR